MIKIKNFVILTFFILSINLNNASFAVEDVNLKDKYPNYSKEFAGEDSWENFNRKIFIFNLKANKYVIRPINIVWASILPQYGIDRVQNFYKNLSYPVRLVGCLLQKDFKSSRTETVRFFTNTTVGLAGLYDPAKSVFKIEPVNENVEQALAYHNVKKGPYLVLPIFTQGNVRDVAGWALDIPLNPGCYIMGPISAISTGVSLVNDATTMQPIFKIAENYADPYEAAKQVLSMDNYIKNKNLDRPNVFKEKTKNENVVEVRNVIQNNGLKADIYLNNYNPQNPLSDAMRTIIFDNQNINNSKWAELSVWNKSFPKKLKISSVSVDYKHPKYKYRYVIQKDKNAPVAIIYPSIGEGYMSQESMMQAKILYDKGYSVVILGSAFQWEFAQSMPDNYKPGLPYQDAHYLRILTSLILNQLQGKYACKFNNKILVGTSFGGLTGLFVASQEEKENILGVSKYIFICPPIEIFFALQQIDKISQDCCKSFNDLDFKAAITAQKVIQETQKVSAKNVDTQTEVLSFTPDEAKLAVSFAMRQKLSDLVFTIEKAPTTRKSNIYEKINNMSFYDYAQEYLIVNQNKSTSELSYNSSLYSLADFLNKNNNYKIYHSLDDCFTSPSQLTWLKKQTGNKSVLFSNGSHLGFLYRKEFLDELNKDISLSK